MSIINKEVNDFSVQAYVGDKFQTVKKSDILGKWSVFFFYPADFTFVCPTELEDLQNIYHKFQDAGCEIYSVSTDTHFVHKAWHDHSERISKLQYPMLADPTHALCKDFEVLIEADGMAERGTTPFVSDDVVFANSVESFDAGQVIKYTLVIWLEGDDPECLDNIMGGTVKMSMHFSVEEEPQS